MFRVNSLLSDAVFEGLSSSVNLADNLNSVTLTYTSFLRILQWHLLQYVSRSCRPSVHVSPSPLQAVICAQVDDSDFTIACDVRAGEHSLLILLGAHRAAASQRWPHCSPPGTSQYFLCLFACRWFVSFRVLVCAGVSVNAAAASASRPCCRLTRAAHYAQLCRPKSNPVLFASTYHAGETLPDAEGMSQKDRVRLSL